MNKEFIPYEQALELKELGFDEPCFARYIKGQLSLYQVDTQHASKETALAPLYQQAFRWFREKYNLQSHIFLTYEGVTTNEHNEYAFATLKAGGYDYVIDDNNYTYEETELACLKKLIEIVKNK